MSSDDKKPSRAERAATRAMELERHQVALQLEAEENAWTMLAIRAEQARMPRRQVAAIRAGFTFLRMLEMEIEHVAHKRAAFAEIVDSYAQDLARGGRAST